MNQIGLARLGRDAELRYTPSGDAVVSLSLAYNWGKKDSEGKRASQWIDATLWGNRAEALAQYLLKGALLYVILEDGHSEEFTRKDGTTGTKWVARVGSVEFAGSRQSSEDGGQRERQAPAAAPAPSAAPARKPAPAASSFENMDDDIPF